MEINFDKMSFSVDFRKGEITLLKVGGEERLAGKSPLFRVCLRNDVSENVIVSSYDAASCIEIENGAVYTGFSGADISVLVCFASENGEAACGNSCE